MRRIRIYTEATGFVDAVLLPDENPRTVEKILEVLPLVSTAYRWGGEIFFEVPVYVEKENPREVVERGDVAYWDTGHSLCIFFGPTPASLGDEIRAVEPVNVIGKVLGDPHIFEKIRDGDKIRVEKVG
ncbi:MAG: hypothetical protein J7L38_04330 [Thermoproteales archaeon]|nr:hypothetical protein [Thermoproteales archaeon]RLE63890.1 MAG: hypothetical protein DRJ47_08900 [Thermoprotei archaeon]